MFSLRIKFTLALLTTSLAALLTVGLVSRWLVYREVSHIALERSFGHFREDVQAYLETYGSWEAGEMAEPFPVFSDRMRGHRPPPGAPAGDPPPFGPPPGEPGRPRVEPGPGGPRRGGPPFFFLVLDREGRVLAGDPSFPRGRPVSAALRATARPIVVHGKAAVWAVPLKNPHLLEEHQAYLNAMLLAVGYGSLIAVGLTLGLGWVLGRRLGGRLRQLTDAAQAITEGNLRQRVPVTCSDEVTTLAKAFNRMSGELERAHEELKRSGERIRAQAEQLKEQSARDGLTGLYNRRALNERGAELYVHATREHQPLSLLICDIDHFKHINDTFSHATGDAVIREVARLLQERTRPGDVVARYGGEEFVLLLPNTPLHQAATGCEMLRRLVEEHDWSEIHPELRVTLSGGISQAASCIDFEHMIAAADAYLYEAKRGGRNQVRYFGSSTLRELAAAAS